jgi:hypothetical protein
VLPHAEEATDEERQPDSYVGSMADGVRQGDGKYTWSDGSSYTGPYVDGKKHGSGTLTFNDGSSYTGMFVHGQISGQGTMHFKNGVRRGARVPHTGKSGAFC